jgi:hypothetical protein
LALQVVELNIDAEAVKNAIEYLQQVAPFELQALLTKLSVDKYWDTKGLG